jgi:FMN phosphatase YigB (HAD superfamily)
MKEIFIMDFDNTVLDTRKCHSLYVNHIYQIKSVPEDFVNNAPIAGVIRKYDTNSSVTDEQALVHLCEEFHTSRAWHMHAEPIDDDVADVLYALSRKYELILATARHDFSEDIVRELLELNFPECVNSIHFVHRRIAYGQYTRTPKRNFVELLGPDRFAAFVDDSVNEIKMMQSLIPSYLFDPWHLHGDVGGILNRTDSWNEIGKLFL